MHFLSCTAQHRGSTSYSGVLCRPCARWSDRSAVPKSDAPAAQDCADITADAAPALAPNSAAESPPQAAAALVPIADITRTARDGQPCALPTVLSVRACLPRPLRCAFCLSFRSDVHAFGWT